MLRLHDLWWLEGGAAQVKGASAIAKNKSEKPHKQEGCTNLNWYSTPANSNFHVYFDRSFVTSVLFEAVHLKNMYILTGTFYGVYSLD